MHLEPGQVAVVTGGASGLGFALARSFAARGLDVVLADVETGVLDDAVKALESSGAVAIGVPTDVREPTQVDALARATIERFGRVDVICNNAGVTTLGGPMWEVEPNDWEWVLSVNLGGVINGVRAFVPHLVAQNSGHVVNTASMAGVSVAPLHGPYLASKHAVVALSEGLELELMSAAPGVGVTVVCPGVIETNIHNADRNRPAHLPGSHLEVTEEVLGQLIPWVSTISGPPMSPDDAAAIVVAAIETNRLHVAPNGSVEGARARVDRLLADFGDA